MTWIYDIDLISRTREHLQQKVTRLNLESKRTGLKINKEKTKVIRMNATTNENIQIDGKDLKDVESVVYLGAKVCTSGGAEEDIRARLGKVWKNNKFSRMTKIKIFKPNVISVLLHGCETWRMTQANEKLDTSLHRSSRRILKIYWPMCITKRSEKEQTLNPSASK